MSNSLIKELLHFLNDSPTAMHAAHFIKRSLTQAGFTELNEKKEWDIKPSTAYFVIRNDSSICAFITPIHPITKAQIVASHTDSPGFKLKPNPEFRRENMTLFTSEIYGAPLLTSWYNRDLGIAGRVFYVNKDGVINHALIDIKDNPVIIPQLAVHLDREANEKGPLSNKQDHFSAIAAVDFDQASYLIHLLKKAIKEPFEYILSHDLFLYPIEKATLLGADLIAGYRLDSLESVHAALSALKTSKPHDNHLNMAVFWNHEEIGSKSANGAESPFLLNVLERICISLNYTREFFLRLLPSSLCVSVDLAHAANPNFMEKHDPRHVPLLARGPVIKYNAGQRYASDSVSSANIIHICEKHAIPYQFFTSRNDMPCGSTIGPINATNTGIPTVDIGSPQLSMHSVREIVSTQDHLEMCRLLACFFSP